MVQHNIVRTALFATTHAHAVFRAASHILNSNMVQRSSFESAVRGIEVKEIASPLPHKDQRKISTQK